MLWTTLVLNNILFCFINLLLSSFQSLSRSTLCDPMACLQATARPPCPTTNSWSLLKLTSIKSVMPSNLPNRRSLSHFFRPLFPAYIFFVFQFSLSLLMVLFFLSFFFPSPLIFVFLVGGFKKYFMCLALFIFKTRQCAPPGRSGWVSEQICWLGVNSPFGFRVSKSQSLWKFTLGLGHFPRKKPSNPLTRVRMVQKRVILAWVSGLWEPGKWRV